MDKNALYGWNEAAKSRLPLLVDADGNLVISEMSSKLDDLIDAIGDMVISLGVMPPASVTNAMLAATAVTEAVTVAKTFTHTSLADAAGILGSQLGAGTVHQVKGTVTYNGAATQAIATLPAGAILLEAIAVCTTAFNGTGPSPAVTVGYASNQTKVIPTCTLTLNAVTGENPSTLGADLYDATAKKCVKFYAAQTVINGYLTAGGSATTGALDVYLIYVQTA